MRQWTFGFHKMRGFSWPAEKLLAYKEDSAQLTIITWRVFTQKNVFRLTEWLTDCFFRKQILTFNFLLRVTNKSKQHAQELWSSSTSGISSYHTVQNLLSSRFLSEHIKLKIHKYIIFPFFISVLNLVSHMKGKSYSDRSRIGCWDRYFEQSWRKLQENGEGRITRSLKIHTAHQILFGWLNQSGWDWRGLCNAWRRRDMITSFWWRNTIESGNLEYLNCGGSMIL